MFNLRVTLLFILLAFLLQGSLAQDNDNTHFIHYNNSDGLSHIGVSCFLQDARGFIWIGTWEGLNRFDGQRFKVFHTNYKDSTTLINDRIYALIESFDSLIWIGTEDGLCVYNPKLEVFDTNSEITKAVGDNKVLKLFEDSKHRIWVLTVKHNLYILDRKKGLYEKIYFNDQGNNETIFTDIVECCDGYLYVASSNGLITINPDLEVVKNNFSELTFVNQLNCISYYGDNALWIGGNDSVFKLQIENKVNEITMAKAIELNDIAANVILKDQYNDVWIGTSYRGITKLKMEKEGYSLHTYRNDPLDPNSLCNDRARTIFEDKQGVIWVGTAENGISKYNPDILQFSNIRSDESDLYGLKTEYVLSFGELENGDILVGTRNGGICQYRPDKKMFVKPDFNTDPLTGRTVSAIYIDSKKNLWIGGWNRQLYRIKHGEHVLERIEPRPPSGVSEICEDDFGNILVGSASFVTYYTLNEKNKVIASGSIDLGSDLNEGAMRVRALYNDPFDYSIWVGTWNDGLIRMKIDQQVENMETVEFMQFSKEKGRSGSIFSNFVTSVLRTSEEDIWLGTEGAGLMHGTINYDSIVFNGFNTMNGLSSNVVKSIVPDSSGQLWIATNNGLNMYDQDKKSFRVYNSTDGLISNYFNNSAFRLYDNRLVFGGNKGFTLFDPTLLKSVETNLVPEIGSFQLSQKTVQPLEKINGRVLLNESIMNVNKLWLKHKENTFSFELLALLNSEFSSNQFMYRLKGYDEDWVYTRESEYFVNYTNVPPGRYTFEFYIVYRDGSLSELSRNINLRILPPWWLSVPAYFVYMLIVSSIFFIAFRTNRRISTLKNRAEIDRIEKEKGEELTEAKVKFFMNVSHEFKTPITLISGPIQWLITKFQRDAETSSYLDTIKKQADYLMNLLDQLVYFRKVETDTLKLHCTYQDIIPIIKNICSAYQWQSTEQRIDFNFYHDLDKAFLWFDKQMMEKVFHNLISNAFKYSKSGSSIHVYLNETENHIKVSVVDHGIGISEDSMNHLFTRFYQEDDSVGGYGIGLSLTKSLIDLHKGSIEIQSEKWKGTTAKVLLKKGNDHLSKSEMKGSDQISEDDVNDQMQLERIEKQIETQNSGSQFSGDKSTLLIVEDNVRMLSFLEQIFKPQYHVLKARNGVEALKITKHNIPDLVISDIMMPEMDGIVLCQTLKTELLTCHIPVILLTAKSDIRDQVDGLGHGADLYIPKPFDISILTAQTESLIDNRNRIKERIRSKLPFDLSAEDKISPLDVELLKKINAVLEENFSNSAFDSTQFSKKLFLNRTMFFAKMKAITNQTPTQYIKEYRVRKAVELMLKEQIPVSEVNERVGIASRSHFVKCFKELFGKSPSAFMKERK